MPDFTFDLPEDGNSPQLFTTDEDGNTVVTFEPDEPQVERYFGENLAEFLEDSVLSRISSDLMRLIEDDEDTRSDWMDHRERGVELLALQVHESKKATGAVPHDGMAAVRHPMLLEACIKYQSNASAELLPAKGPIRIVNDSGEVMKDAPAVKLQRNLNAYLRLGGQYYADTERAIFQSGWSGAAFKKGYHCPLKQRPVIDSVDAKDLIISNQAASIDDAPRITHKIYMDKSKLVRMQIVGAYRKIDLPLPNEESDVVKEAVADTQGISTSTDPEVTNRPIYECYCSYDIPGYEHLVDDSPSGLELPYKISIDITSRLILEIRRDWNENDPMMNRRRTFIMYPFIPMFGLYPYGLLHLLGNSTSAITTAWRLLLDSGVFANFPSFAYAKNGEIRQQKTDFRAGPGEGVGVDLPPGAKIQDSLMSLPFKSPDAATMSLVDNIERSSQRLAGTTEIKVGEGREIPVGTMAMAIEQTIVVMSGIHRRMHQAQMAEFSLLKELLQEDPEALWRHKRNPPSYQEQQEMLQILGDNDLIPVADPNMPSHLYRIIRALTVKQFADANPDRYNGYLVDEYCLQQMGVEDPRHFFVPPPKQQGMDPVQAMAMVEHEKNAVKVQTDHEKAEIKKLDISMRHQEKEADRKSKEAVEAMKLAANLYSGNG